VSKAHEDYISQPKDSGYRALHLIVEVEVPHGVTNVPIPVEVQIRTLLQHAWGELTHEDTFKPGVPVPELIRVLSKRLATALTVLDEIAQDLRDELNKIEKGASPETAPVATTAAPTPRRGVRIDLSKTFQEVFDRPLSASQLSIRDLNDVIAANGGISSKQLTQLLTEARAAARTEFRRSNRYISDGEILEVVSIALAEGKAVEAVLETEERQRLDEAEKKAQFDELYAPGTIHLATVVRLTPRYVVAKLPDGSNAVISARSFEGGRKRINLEDFIAPGATIQIQVVRPEYEKRRVEGRLEV
jgi:Region found in RelA / SpoT proteins